MCNSGILDAPLLIQCNVTLIFCFKYPDPEPPRIVTKVKKELFTPEKENPPKDIVKQETPDTPPEVIRDSIPASLPTVFVMNTAKQVCLGSAIINLEKEKKLRQCILTRQGLLCCLRP